MKKLKVKFTTTDPMLGMTPSTPELYTKFLEITAKKLGVRAAALTPEKTEEELKALRLDRDETTQENRGFTVYPRDANGNPIFWDYQIRGFLKDSFRALLQTSDKDWSKASKCPLNNYNVAKRVDQILFVEPRQIVINVPEGTEITFCERPIRKPSARNSEVEESAIGKSEQIEAGATFEVTFVILNDDYVPFIKKACEYAKFRGFGQWRNSGKGRATCEFIEES